MADYREGTDPVNSVRKLHGLRKYPNLVFKRGYTPDDTLWKWYARIAGGADERYDGSVVLMNEAHKDVMRWNFENAWINKIEGPSLKAAGNELAIEGMEIVHEGIMIELEPAPAA
jgi:phage tail-like protein